MDVPSHSNQNAVSVKERLGRVTDGLSAISLVHLDNLTHVLMSLCCHFSSKAFGANATNPLTLWIS